MSEATKQKTAPRPDEVPITFVDEIELPEATQKKLAPSNLARLENAVRRFLLQLNIRVTFEHFKRSGLALTIPLLLMTMVLIWWSPGLFVPLVDETHPHSLYLLSAIAQSLAAILALVFSISLRIPMILITQSDGS